jgi:hypothetical protein
VRVLDDEVRQQAWPHATWAAFDVRPGTWAAAEGDGLRLRYRFEGSSAAEYPNCQVLETAWAVALLPDETRLPAPTRRPTGMFHTVEARLVEPLGGRVLVSKRGAQVPVSFDGSDPWADHRPMADPG